MIKGMLSREAVSIIVGTRYIEMDVWYCENRY